MFSKRVVIRLRALPHQEIATMQIPEPYQCRTNLCVSLSTRKLSPTTKLEVCNRQAPIDMNLSLNPTHAGLGY
jgi:hypothetical protein